MKYELNEMMYYLEFIVKLVENGINELDFVKRFTWSDWSEMWDVCTVTNGNNHTPRVFSTKTQDFTPMFLKPVVEVQLFLLGSELSKDKNSESPSFKHFRPETSMGDILKLLQIIFSNKLISEKNLQNFE